MKILLSILLMCFFVPASAQAQAIGVWQFNGDANNAAGYGANGVVYNATLTTGRSGIPFTAYQFNGINSHIDIPFDTLWNMRTWTIQTAVRIDGFNADTCQEEGIVSYGTQNAGNFYAVSLTDNVHDNSCTTYSPNNTEFVASAAGTAAPAWYDGSYIQLHQWYCLTFTYDGRSIKRYINSTFVDSLQWTNQYNYGNTQSSLVFGYSPGSGGNHPNWLNGAIDIVTIYATNVSGVVLNPYNCNVVILSIDPYLFLDTIQCAGVIDSLYYVVNLGNIVFPGNIFTLQLSDTTGSFANPVNIGSDTATTASGYIKYKIPATIPAGTGYRMRMVSSNKPITGEPNHYPIKIIPAPAVTIATNTDTVCAQTPVLFTAITNSGSSATYQWKKNGANVGINNSEYTDSTLVTGDQVTCVVTTTSSCSGVANIVSNSIKVVVVPIPVSSVNIAASTNAAICAYTPVTFSATVVNGGTPGYQWLRNGIAIPGSTAAIYVDNSLVPGDIITCAATGSQQCATRIVSQPIALTINPIPDTTVTALGPIHVCTGDSIMLQAGGAGSIYKWQLNGTDIAGATSNSYTVHNTGNYTVFITNSFNCSITSTTVAATVSPKPNSSIVNAGGFLQICTNDSLLLSTTFGGNPHYTYQWLWNGIALANATSYAYTTKTAGQYQLIVSNNGCMTTSAPLNVTTVPAPVDTFLTPIEGVLCPGSTASISLSGGVPGSAETYQWYKNGIPITGATAASYPANFPATYVLKVTDNANGCSAYSEAAIITEGSVPAPVIRYEWPAFATSAYSTYQWYYNGTAIANATVADYTPTQSGVYTVLVTDANGCTGMSANYYFAYSSVPNTTIGNTSINVYPNPANTTVYVDAAIPVTAALYEMDSRLIMTVKEAKQLDISALADGVYLLSISDDNGNVLKVMKVVKN